MKKKISLILIFSCLLAVSCLAQTSSKKDYASMNLKGRVKSLKEVSYSVTEISGKPTKGRAIKTGLLSTTNQHYYSLFDEQGNCIKDSSDTHNSNNTLTGKVTVVYDSMGKKIESQYTDADSFTSCKYLFTYNSNGDLIREISYYSVTGSSLKNGILQKTILCKYEYDSTGNWVKRTDVEEGKPQCITERLYEYY